MGREATTQTGTVDIEDLEQASKENRAPRPAKRYRIRVDKEHYEVPGNSLTGREVLELAGKCPPEQYLLYQRLRGGQREKIGLDETVDLTKPGVERFMTLPKDQTEG